MKKILLTLIVLSVVNGYSQKTYFIEGKDTTFCQKIDYKLTVQSYLKSINYTDLNGKDFEIKGRKNLEDVMTFCKYGVITDKIPQKANKPKGYVKWVQRVVDGKLKLYYYHNEFTVSNFGSSFNNGHPTTSSITKFFIKMPDGTFYDIRKNRDLKKHIIPYLKQCDAFNSAYNGDFISDYENFTKMIVLYNSVCK